jgi:3-oxoacyl-[acyl-carrier-protein] synthase-1
MSPLAVTAYTLSTALGAGRAAHLAALREGRCGLAPCRFGGIEMPGFVGEVAGLEAVALPPALADYDCRNNRLAWLALQQDGFIAAVHAARERFGRQRVALLLGTSSSGILETELAYRQRTPDGALPAGYRYAETHNASSVAFFAGRALGLQGPANVISTACSSGAKVFAAAARMIAAGFVDAAVVGAVDSLCLTTLYGFRSLELFSSEICRPWDAGRKGLSLAEGAAFALLERDASPKAWLLGTGESSDGHHMSAPHPEGAGAIAAMRLALADAALEPGQIDYVNLHGTATPSNDAAEDRAVTQVFGREVACSSTKGATGHTLGAAGAVEAAIGLLALEHGLMPGGLHVQRLDPALGARYLTRNVEAPLRAVLSNSFGFGGSNACLVFGAAG